MQATLCLALLVTAFLHGQLLAIINTEHLGNVVCHHTAHTGALGHGAGNDVGQIKFTLGIVVIKCGYPATQAGGRGRNKTGVNLLQGAL